MRFLVLITLLFTLSCAHKSEDPILKVLSSDNSKIKTVVDQIQNHEVQILFTEIERNGDSVSFKDYSYQVNDSNYFYPASTVKFPIAILALEKMNTNPLINRNTVFNVEGDSVKTTLSDDIKKIFAVSDNEAYNRLFEYLGKDYINSKLSERGINARISHRLSVPNSDITTTKSLIFYDHDSIIFKTDSIINKPIEPLPLQHTIKGKGYMVNDSLVNSPMDFSLKNYLPITSLHNIMKQLMFPELYPYEKQFHVSPDDRDFLIKTMTILPQEAGYTSDEYYESYVKFLVFGDSKQPLPNYIKIYNKVGDAYGYLTDCAYIINEKTNKEYIITATIHVNKNQIFNDNTYEYDTVGFPFLAELGRQLINY
ncbi:MAG: class A beta-lactamase-related serine hydrolase [Flavobacteriaceae bacterium]|nr:class A beta-lactamase-related serine hydrolase [Flavobacteriaceae bacterium]